MKKLISHRAKRPGLSPGSLVHIGEKKAERVRMRVMQYNADSCTEREAASIEECLALPRPRDAVTWICIDGLHDPNIVEAIGAAFGIHPLVLEDILHTSQRPKVESFDDYLYVVMRMFRTQDGNGEIHSDQFSLLLGRDWLVTFEEGIGSTLDPIRERIRRGLGHIRSAGADYLAYALSTMTK